ncbi:uncharacterized protein EI97DRAFT_62798 [Westerdykella ornata]|uniref:Uncharacterized protein n=1 Tax=Westerdykella ornata TaxID=318751 RepID=A0A6A6JHE8_WESOR|nr:uncharacterized protein EI97DRAFT_62798 [Westerdykella ornata]KAF2275981.1 hypothetical protein EI97DRAFT_62798 [Westerdykella ornata]
MRMLALHHQRHLSRGLGSGDNDFSAAIPHQPGRSPTTTPGLFGNERKRRSRLSLELDWHVKAVRCWTARIKSLIYRCAVGAVGYQGPSGILATGQRVPLYLIKRLRGPMRTGGTGSTVLRPTGEVAWEDEVVHLINESKREWQEQASTGRLHERAPSQASCFKFSWGAGPLLRLLTRRVPSSRSGYGIVRASCGI